MGTVVHLPLARPLKKGLTVIDRGDRKGEIVGFHKQWSWAFRRPQFVSFVIVDFGPVLGRRYMQASDLRVVETVSDRRAS